MNRKYAIIGSALSGNKGAAAMLESAIQTLDDGSTEFTLLSMYPEDDKRLNTYDNLRILRADPIYLGCVINTLAVAYRILPFLRKFILRNPQLKAIVEADALLDQGGITFVDGRGKFLIYNIASILPALMVRTKVVKCAQAIGPFKNRINRIAAKMFLPKMALIVSRGAITHEHLTQMKFTNVIEGADYAFLLEVTPEEKLSAQESLNEHNFGSKKIVGISPSVVMQKKVDASGKNYAKIISQFINKLIEDDYAVVLIPHSLRLGTDKTHNNDLPLCKVIFNQIQSPEHCAFLDQELTSQELRAAIGTCDFFVASRFHAMVSSLAMEVPTIVIGWSHKYKEVLEMFELDECAFGHDQLTSEYLEEQFEKLVVNEDSVRSRLETNLPTVKKLSTLQVSEIKKL